MSNYIYDYISSIKAINTHSHYGDKQFFNNFCLQQMLSYSYIAWSGVDYGDSVESRDNYFSKVKYKSYFHYLQKALKAIYHINEDLDTHSWDKYAEAIKRYHAIDGFRYELLEKVCNYDKIIMDAYWNLGFSHDDDLFIHALNVGPLFYAHSRDNEKMEKTNPMGAHLREFNSLDSVVSFASETIAKNVNNGCVALKSAIAYDRGLKFTKVDKVTGQKVFNYNHTVKEHIVNFQNYLMYEISKIAAWQDVPFQIHTGLGSMDNTNAAQLNSLIKNNPETKFVLFHGSFPWTDDIVGLLHTYSNVYADLCWLPLISPTAAKYTLHQMIEVATADKITWGCDTWTAEESLGARFAINEVLSDVLDEKIQCGYLSMNDAKIIADNIMHNNAKQLYKI